MFLTHPYSIFIHQVPLNKQDTGRWIKPIQAYTQEYAIYVTNLVHQDSKSVIKVVRYVITMAAFPDKEAVDRVGRYLAKYRYDLRDLL